MAPLCASPEGVESARGAMRLVELLLRQATTGGDVVDMSSCHLV